MGGEERGRWKKKKRRNKKKERGKERKPEGVRQEAMLAARTQRHSSADKCWGTDPTLHEPDLEES